MYEGLLAVLYKQIFKFVFCDITLIMSQHRSQKTIESQEDGQKTCTSLELLQFEIAQKRGFFSERTS